MPGEEIVRFQWVVHASELKTQRAELLAMGAILEAEARPYGRSEEDDLNGSIFTAVGPLAVLAGVISISLLADLIFKIIRNIKYKGLIIDARDRELLIREHPALEQGNIVVISSENVQHFASSKEVDFLTALKALVLGS